MSAIALFAQIRGIWSIDKERRWNKMAESKTEMLGAVYWGYMQSKDVLDSSGRYVGILRGIMIDNKWTIPEVIIEVNKGILDEFGVDYDPLFDVALVNLPTEHVKNVGDVVQLTDNVASLKGIVKLYFE
jgi:sporulation protein YlmC with PRC-barrel domain